LLISNHNSFRVLLDKIACVYFIWKKNYFGLYFSVGNGHSREQALCQLYRHAFVSYLSWPGFIHKLASDSAFLRVYKLYLLAYLLITCKLYGAGNKLEQLEQEGRESATLKLRTRNEVRTIGIEIRLVSTGTESGVKWLRRRVVIWLEASRTAGSR